MIATTRLQRPASLHSRRFASATLTLATLAMTGCATTSLTGLLERPAERALYQGLRAYDDGQYVNAEKEFQSALSKGLAHGADRATAHKHLAFIQCTSQRLPACEQSFKAAREADATFTLNKAEVGHPVWGPVYRRVVEGR